MKKPSWVTAKRQENILTTNSVHSSEDVDAVVFTKYKSFLAEEVITKGKEVIEYDHSFYVNKGDAKLFLDLLISLGFSSYWYKIICWESPDYPHSFALVGEKGLCHYKWDIDSHEGKYETCRIALFTTSKAVLDTIIDFITRKVVRIPKRQTVHTISSSGNGLEIKTLGYIDSSLIPENYTPEVLEGYDLIVKDILSTNPSGRLAIFDGPAGSGKAQPLDALVYTPNGPKKMGELSLGELVCTPTGSVAKILNIFPQGKKDIYQVNFSDGTFTETCKEHLWKVDNKNSGWANKIVDTAYLLEKYKKSRRRDITIKCTEPVHFKTRPTLIQPYTFGLLLGDGGFSNSNLTFTSADQENISAIESSLPEGYLLRKANNSTIDFRIVRKHRNSRIKNPFKEALKFYGLWGLKSTKKFIPKDYLYGDEASRWAILQGLLDSDGTIDKRNGHVYLSTSSDRLAKDFQELVLSLGGICTLSTKKPFYSYKGARKEGQINYLCTLSFKDMSNCFRLVRKQKFIKQRTKYFPEKRIVSISLIGKKEAQCILIDSEEHLYLTDGFIPTHNTHLIKALITDCDNVVFLLVPPDSVESLTGPSLVSLLLDIKSEGGLAFDMPVCLILEDADNALVPRARDNMSIITSLLNCTDGIFGTIFDLKVVATTNAKGVEIEEALLRAGRLSAEVTVEELPVEQANKILKRLGSTHKVTEPARLADLYAIAKGVKTTKQQSQRKNKKSTMGF